MAKKNKIYIKQWLELKPYLKQVKTDFYYLGLCNKVKDALVFVDNKSGDLGLYDEEIDTISCMLVSYFEDIISQTNIWATFVKLHDKMYGKKLPFYDVPEYFDDEINETDVKFLLWYSIHILTDEIEDDPFNEFVIAAASKVMKIFDEVYEYAPENEDLKKEYFIDDSETDFYVFREFAGRIVFNSYLFFPDTANELNSLIEDLLEEGFESENHAMTLMNSTRDTYLLTLHTKLLSLKANEWAAHLLDEDHPMFKNLMDMGDKFTGYFINKSEDDENIVLEHIASGREFKVTKKSIDHLEMFKEKGIVVLIGLAKWMGEWWFSGMFGAFNVAESLKIIKEEKNNMSSSKTLPWTEEQKRKAKDFTQKQEEAFLKFNKGSRLVFMPKYELNDYIYFFTKYFNKLQGGKDESPKSKINIGKDDVEETVVMFFNPKSGIEIAFMPNAFPSKENKTFDEYESDEDTYALMYSSDISTELSNYCIDNYKDKLEFFKTDFGKLFLENSDFLLRFWKGSNYHTNFELSFSNK